MRSAFDEAPVVALVVVLAATPVLAQGVVARTPWGDPDLQGVYSNENEMRVPMERPARFAGRGHDSLTAEELARFGAELNAATLARSENQAFRGLSPQRYDLKPRRAWFVVDPPDGKIPALTPVGAQRAKAYADRNARTPLSADDTNLWYRCISIGVPRSMMPFADAGTFRIVQSPGYVAIQYEMLHEARVIPLGRRPHVGSDVRAYMGDARGYWDGDTLVVETTNIKGQFQLTSAGSENLRVVERFTRTSPDTVEWSATIDDASGWVRPWTFSMPLERVGESQSPLESACHEGNYTLRNILSAARAEERDPPD